MRKEFFSNTNRKSLLNDLVLIFAVLAVAVIALFVFKATQKEGNSVIVTVDGVKKAEYRLDTNIKQTINTENGKNTLEIEDGMVYISMADCPDKICKKHRPISKSGESIICLPHKLVVKIENDNNSNMLDAEA